MFRSTLLSGFFLYSAVQRAVQHHQHRELLAEKHHQIQDSDHDPVVVRAIKAHSSHIPVKRQDEGGCEGARVLSPVAWAGIKIRMRRAMVSLPEWSVLVRVQKNRASLQTPVVKESG